MFLYDFFYGKKSLNINANKGIKFYSTSSLLDKCELKLFILSEIDNRVRLFNCIDYKKEEYVNYCSKYIIDFIIHNIEYESNNKVENIPIIKCKNNTICIWSFFSGLKFNYIYFEFIIYKSMITQKFYIENQTIAYINEILPLNINKYDYFDVKI